MLLHIFMCIVPNHANLIHDCQSDLVLASGSIASRLVLLHHVGKLLPHRLPDSVRFAEREAREITTQTLHLFLVNHDAKGFGQHRLKLRLQLQTALDGDDNTQRILSVDYGFRFPKILTGLWVRVVGSDLRQMRVGDRRLRLEVCKFRV